MNKNTAKKSSLIIPVVYKVAFSLIIIILVVASIVSYSVFLSLQDQKIQNKVNELQKITEYQEVIIANEFQVVGDRLKGIANELDIITFLENDNEDSNLYDFAKNRLVSYNTGSLYESIYVLNADGLTVASTNPVFEGNNYGFRDYFTQVSADKVYTTTALGISTNNMGYYFSYPIYSQEEKGKLLGVVAIKIGEKNIENLFLQRYGWDIYLLDSYGVFILSTDDNLTLRSLSEVPILAKYIGEKKSQYLGKEIISLDQNKLWQNIKVSTNTSYYKLSNFVNSDEDFHLVAKRVGDFDYFILTSIKEKVIISHMDNFAIKIFWKIMIAALIATILVIIATNWILSPIKKINKLVKLIANGSYNNLIEVNTSDEFEDLSISLNKLQEKVLADSMQVSQSADEEQKISQKKVDDLEKLNSLMVNRELELVRIKDKMKILERKCL